MFRIFSLILVSSLINGAATGEQYKKLTYEGTIVTQDLTQPNSAPKTSTESLIVIKKLKNAETSLFYKLALIRDGKALYTLGYAPAEHGFEFPSEITPAPNFNGGQTHKIVATMASAPENKVGSLKEAYDIEIAGSLELRGQNPWQGMTDMSYVGFWGLPLQQNGPAVFIDGFGAIVGEELERVQLYKTADGTPILKKTSKYKINSCISTKAFTSFTDPCTEELR